MVLSVFLYLGLGQCIRWWVASDACGFFESALVAGPVQGTWTVEIINNGHGNVAYGLTVAVGY